jgi:uncharacterized protein (DUF2336 family)
MSGTNDLLQELEAAISQGTPERRLAALTYATDQLISGRYSDDAIWMFGEVVSMLASEIEVTVRAQLANRIAPYAKAPTNIVNKLAFDNSIAVAGPVLRQSERLTDQALVDNAKTKSQEHLLAISQRKSLHPDVTDVLVSRGNQTVVRSVARNVGARFSDSGFWNLVQRSENDVTLAVDVGMRKDIPRHHFQMLIAKASDEVKARLEAANPGAALEIRRIVTDVTGRIQAKFGPASRSYFAAKKQIGVLFDTGRLKEADVCEFAKARKFEEVTVALSLICDLPVNVVERALLDDRQDMVLILAKAAKLSWPTAQLLLVMCAGDASISAHDMDSAMKNFSLLTVETARQVINFHKSRQQPENTASAPAARLRS